MGAETEYWIFPKVSIRITKDKQIEKQSVETSQWHATDELCICFAEGIEATECQEKWQRKNGPAQSEERNELISTLKGKKTPTHEFRRCGCML